MLVWYLKSLNLIWSKPCVKTGFPETRLKFVVFALVIYLVL